MWLNVLDFFIDLIADFVTLRIKVGSHKSSVCRVFTRCF